MQNGKLSVSKQKVALLRHYSFVLTCWFSDKFQEADEMQNQNRILVGILDPSQVYHPSPMYLDSIFLHPAVDL